MNPEEKVLEVLKKATIPLTKGAICNKTGLHPYLLVNIIEDLVDKGTIIETKKELSTGAFQFLYHFYRKKK